jgi:hypothetical protein
MGAKPFTYLVVTYLPTYLPTKNLLLATELGLKDVLVVSIVMKVLLGYWVKTIDNSCWWSMHFALNMSSLHKLHLYCFMAMEINHIPKKIGNNVNLMKGCNPRV